ncbi:MAG: site-specific integrase, partial [Actinomycetia bacterium]|nr:site-specific integrase [Actinomycetes bacterium]
MGHIKDRWKEPGRRGKGLRWQVRYQVDGREKVGGSFDVKAVAQRKLVELEASVHRGQWVNPHDQTTVTAECRSYAASRPHADTTAERVESMIRNHVEPTPLGKMRIAAVRPGDIQRWVTERAGAGMAPSTLRVLVRLVRSTFAAAVLDRRVSSSPFVRIALPAAEAERIVPLAAAQVVALRAAMAPRYRAMVTTQAGLGLRVGELLALRT